MKTNSKGKMVASLTLGVTMWLVGAPASLATVYTFRQGVNGYTGASSTFTEYQPAEAQSYNYGSRTVMLVYTPAVADPPQKVAFMRFDLSSISSPVSVASASMTIGVAGDPIRQPGYSLTYNIYPILRPDLNFGSSNGAAENGALSFNAASYDPTSPIGWGSLNTGNYGPVAGQDYSMTSIGSFTLTDANVNESFVTFSLSSSAVASWINNPSTNYGFVIVADAGGDQAIIYTGYESEVYRPVISIDATAIPEPTIAGLLGLGMVAFTFIKRSRTGIA
jgi:hypothetical protein